MLQLRIVCTTQPFASSSWKYTGVRAGTVRVAVETPAGRSRAVPFVAWDALRAFFVDPPGARPG